MYKLHERRDFCQSLIVPVPEIMPGTPQVLNKYMLIEEFYLYVLNLSFICWRPFLYDG
jgi:hypothetical protein